VRWSPFCVHVGLRNEKSMCRNTGGVGCALRIAVRVLLGAEAGERKEKKRGEGGKGGRASVRREVVAPSSWGQAKMLNFEL